MPSLATHGDNPIDDAAHFMTTTTPTTTSTMAPTGRRATIALLGEDLVDSLRADRQCQPRVEYDEPYDYDHYTEPPEPPTFFAVMRLRRALLRLALLRLPRPLRNKLPGLWRALIPLLVLPQSLTFRPLCLALPR